MKTFDPTRPVQTRDGREARILCTDRKGSSPILALVTCVDGNENVAVYFMNGFGLYSRESSLDLVNVPVETFQYQNVWRDRHALSVRYDTLEQANDYHGKNKYVRHGYNKYRLLDGEMVSVEFIKE